MKLAILIPEGYDLACLRKARLLAEAAKAGFNLRGARLSVAFGLSQPVEAVWRRDEAVLTKGIDNAVVRHLVWERVPACNVARMFPWNRRHVPLGLKTVSIPRDWGTNFVDCDIWFNLADPAMGAVFTHRPTAHFCTDLSAREHPYAYAENYADPRWEAQTAAFQLWRSDALVVAGDANTARDLTSYGGVHPDKVMLVPGLDAPLDMADAPKTRGGHARLSWRVEPNPAHDLYNALKGLGIYLYEHGELDFHILSEAVPASFGKGSNAAAVVHLPPDCRALLQGLRVEYITSDADLAFQLAKSVGLWSTRIAGGESSVLTEGFAAGLPLLAVDTALHREWHRRTGKNLILYPTNSPIAVADALHAFEALCQKSDREGHRRPEPHERALIAQHVGFVIDRLMELCDD